uniref:Putative sh2a n=1 Tax=Schistosoma mansoni TaxID=6183 RepID=A0A3Q0KMW1_SCHMA
MQEQSKRQKFLSMVEKMYVEPEELEELTEHEKFALFSAIKSEQIKRYNKWIADQEHFSKNTDNGKSNNNQPKKRVNYLCGPDGKLIVTTALAPDYDRTIHSDGCRSLETAPNISSKSIVLIREFESTTKSSEPNGMDSTITADSTTPTKTTIATTTTTAITTPTTVKSIFTTNVTFSTTTLTNTINSCSVANNTTNVSYSTDNAIMTYRDDKQTNNHFIPSLSNTINYNDNTTSCNVPTMNGHCQNCHNIIDNNNNNNNNNKINNDHNNKNIQSQTNGQYISIIKSFVQDNENNQNSFKKINNSSAPIITNETVATMTKNVTQPNHFYSPEIETTLNLYSQSNDFHSNNSNNNNARIDVQRKGGGRGVQVDNQEEITQFKNNNIDINMHRNDYKHQESDNTDTLIVCISNNNRNNTSVIMKTTTPYDNNDNSNNRYVDTNNIIMRTTNSDHNNIDVSSSINSNTSSIVSNNRNYYLDLDKQLNNNKRINNNSMNLKNSYESKNAFELTTHNRPNNSNNSTITILTDPSNTTNQGSDVSIDDAMPLSTITTTNKTLKRFVLTRSPLSSPPVTTPTSVSPAPYHQNHHINERTPPSSVMDNTNSSITKSHFNRISLLNNPYNLSHQNYGQIDPSFSSSTSELDKISSSITFSSNPSDYIIKTSFTKQPEPQQSRQEKKQPSSLINHQQSQQRITLNNNNNNNLSSLQQHSNYTDNSHTLNPTFSTTNSPPSIFPRPAFWTPDVRTSRKINNIIQEDPKTKVYKWFESYEAARLLVDFGLPITGFSPNLSSLTFSRVPEWFHGFLSREQAERLLTKSDKNGSFLLHLNESFLGYVISLFTSSYCNHFLVSVIAVKQTNSGSRNTTKSTYQLYGVANPEQFTDLRDLVKFYSVHSLGRNNNQQLLLYPVGQENPTLPDYLDIFYSRPDSNSSTRL